MTTAPPSEGTGARQWWVRLRKHFYPACETRECYEECREDDVYWSQGMYR